MKLNNYLKQKIYFIFRMDCNSKCRFCYNYKPQSLVETCCVPPVCATNESIALISSCLPVVNNSNKTSERSLLLQAQQTFLREVAATNIASTIQYTQQNISSINNTLYGQLQLVRKQRYEPYQPYIPPVIPQSVMELQMNTVNAGVPVSFFTIADCKGSQFVTT